MALGVGWNIPRKRGFTPEIQVAREVSMGRFQGSKRYCFNGALCP